MFKRIRDYLHADLWRVRLRDQPRRRSLPIRLLRVIVLSMRGFDEDKCSLRASALTFYSLMSIVPVLAMAFGIAKGFGFQEALRDRLYAAVQTQGVPAAAAAPLVSHSASDEVMISMSASSELMAGHLAETASAEVITDQREALVMVLDQAISASDRLLENTSGGLVAGIGVAFLLWAVIKLLTNIERSFNDIWGIKRSRTWGRRLSDYLSVMLIAPLLIIMSSSIIATISAMGEALVERLAFLGPLAPLLLSGLKILPFAVIWSVFTFLYLFMPNTRVRFRSGLLGGIVAGTLYVLIQAIYIHFQIGVSKLGAIYGSFAALPLFLVWLQVSWLIVLYGAELAFAHQNVDTYEFEPDCLGVSEEMRRLVALEATRRCVRHFQAGEDPPTAEDLAHEMEVPIRLMNEVLFELVEARVLSEVRCNGEERSGYQPGQFADALTIQRVLELLDKHGRSTLPLVHSGEMQRIAESVEQMRRTVAESKMNLRLGDI